MQRALCQVFTELRVDNCIDVSMRRILVGQCAAGCLKKRCQFCIAELVIQQTAKIGFISVSIELGVKILAGIIFARDCDLYRVVCEPLQFDYLSLGQAVLAMPIAQLEQLSR